MKFLILSVALQCVAWSHVAAAAIPSVSRPLVIAHRGASGYLPEHTIEAYWAAMQMGADFIEPDLVITKDGVLIARHEPNITSTTDVRSRPEFSDRLKRKWVDGVEEEGFFAEDFTLTELKSLRAVQRVAFRDQKFNGMFTVPTLVEVIDAIKNFEYQTGRHVGIYPETKHPTYFRDMGLPLEEKLIATLMEQKFTDPRRVFIQSFEVSNLKDILVPLLKKNGLKIPLVQLLDDRDAQPYDYKKAGRTENYGDLIRAASLKNFVATYAAGIGPWKGSIVRRKPATATDLNGDGKAEAVEQLSGETLPVIADAHAAGLLVHPYTFRDEEVYLAVDYGRPEAEYNAFFNAGVDGVFTDFTDTAVRSRALFQSMTGGASQGKL
ncbi:MAG TPA: glycerophosphodiester phosphodiesterase [Oligoflexus sp.]|uniref:glycerophosphodiester phosphodiesterase n=1 Tax=Oligoflexus sp. TaxID=1971216 RepID=UPI002D2E1FD0|nr:glycerophosphodiester phosphodiesterase [Oligoflexus sp.]HYX37170.1 glycerophosphodiester phosphodiesterase [Oligoflexus sp.]